MEINNWVLFPQTSDDTEGPNIVAKVLTVEEHVVTVELKNGTITVPKSQCTIVNVQIKGLNDLAADVYENAKSKGWYDNNGSTNMGERLALIHAEASEALEADRKDRYFGKGDFPMTEDYILSLTNDEEFVAVFEMYVKGTFQEEIADVAIRCLDNSAYKQFDIEKHIRMKMRYNTLREYKHGGKRY